MTSFSDATTRSRSSSNGSSSGKNKKDGTDGEDETIPNQISFSPNEMFSTKFDEFGHDLSFCLPIEFDKNNYKNNGMQKKCCNTSNCTHDLTYSADSNHSLKSNVKNKVKRSKAEPKNPKKYVAKKHRKNNVCNDDIKNTEFKFEIDDNGTLNDCATSNETSVKETSSEGTGSSIADTDWLAISKSSADNDNDHQDENVTSKRRKLSLVVPNPRKPRIAAYTCYICSEIYEMTVVDNPWWSVYVHKCPHCNKHQVPRIDISLEKNLIDHDPNISALYGEGIEENGDEEDEQNRDDDDDDNDDRFIENNVSEEGVKDAHPFDDEGYLQVDVASKLLLLMCHARTCSGLHQNSTHSQVCLSTKYIMLHIRDCNGIDIHGRECKFSWCMPCKAMLRHLTNCYNPDSCKVCNPPALPESYAQLKTLNENIRIKQKDAASKNVETGSSI